VGTVVAILSVVANNAFERPWVVGGPRLSAAEASWPAAQLNR
jgi:hypothetical protein